MRYLVLASLICGVFLSAGETPPPAIVSHINVVSDKVEDVSSIDAWKRSFIKEGMTDKEKALAVWTTVVKFRQQDNPPREYLQGEETPIDPIKLFNVYGYCMCNGASGTIMSLSRQLGLKARGWTITNHSVPEVWWDNKWHLLDASLIVYFPQPDGHILSVDEISAAVEDWYKKNPGMRGDEKKMYAFSKDFGWKKNGPPALSHTPYYDFNGWLPAATHGWYSTMQEYDNHAKHFLYEYGVALGYHLNVQLRPGEKLTRNWSNQGLHVNLLENSGAGSLNGVPGKDDLRYSPLYGDLAPGRIGNGTHEFKPFVSRDLRSALKAEGVRIGADFKTNSPVLSTINEVPGEVIYRLPSSYVYLGGTLQFDNINAGRTVTVEFSRNNGLDWTEIGKTQTLETLKIDMKPHIYRLYDYQIRLKLGPLAAIENLSFTHTIQHSQRALPALGQGENKLTFNAGPQEGTITLEGAMDPNRKAKNLVYTEFHPQLENVGGVPLILSGGSGTVTFPITTPGDIKRLRVGFHYRARDKADSWELQASFDGGKTFKAFGTAEGPTPGNSITLVCNDVPAGARSALVRFAGKQRNTTCFLDWRIDADYAEPNGGFRPVKITYIWMDGGEERKNIHIAKSPQETFSIFCDAKPLMKSYTVELAD